MDMGEPRRIELVTVEATPKVKSSKKRRTTVRLEVEIGDSTDKTCPEFSYTELLKKHLVSMLNPLEISIYVLSSYCVYCKLVLAAVKLVCSAFLRCVFTPANGTMADESSEIWALTTGVLR